MTSLDTAPPPPHIGTVDDAPPSYDATSSSAPPTEQHQSAVTSFPSLPTCSPPYNVNGHLVSLVDTEQVKAHLQLLPAFVRLRQRVDAEPADESKKSTVPLDTEERWQVFIAMAVYRFELWLTTDPSLRVVPLDVLLVWWAFASSEPTRYHEDLDRVYRGQLNDVDLVTLHAQDVADGKYNEDKEAVHNWEKSTGTPWDPLESLRALATTGRPVRCPFTGEVVTAPWYTAADGTGYSQPGFAIAGPQRELNHELLGVGRLIDDCRIAHENPEFYLGGTGRLAFHSALGEELPLSKWEESKAHYSASASDRGKLVSSYLFKSKDGRLFGKAPFKQAGSKLGDNMEWSLTGAHELLQTELTKVLSGGLSTKASSSAASKHVLFKEARLAAITDIVDSYTRGEPFSVDLQALVLEQTAFIAAVSELGWAHPSTFESNDSILRAAIMRYHAFLDLTADVADGYVAPPLDIDLVWRTHALFPGEYYGFTTDKVGWFPSQAPPLDKAQTSEWQTSLTKLWKTRFGTSLLAPSGGLDAYRQALEAHVKDSKDKKAFGYQTIGLVAPPMVSFTGSFLSTPILLRGVNSTGNTRCDGNADGRVTKAQQEASVRAKRFSKASNYGKYGGGPGPMTGGGFSVM